MSVSRRLRQSLGALPQTASGHLHSSALEELTAFGSNPGGLRAWLHVPREVEARPALVVVLHGCTQTAASYDRGSGWSELADERGFIVLYPEQQRANNPNTCFSWFAPAQASRGQGEAASIAQMIDGVIREHSVDPARVFVTGLSAGGGMANAMLAAYPELFAGGAIIAGLPYGTARNVPQAFERMRGEGGPCGARLGELVRGASKHAGPWPAISVWQGSADTTVAPLNAQLVVEQWQAVHVPVEADRPVVSGGHRHTVWRNAAGKTVIELHELAGMGHGTPLATGGEERLGNAGPFMLEAGVSSTHHIARSWGLLEGELMLQPAHPPRAKEAPRPSPALRTTHAPIHPPIHQGSGPQAIIEKALRSAGLMK